MSLDFSRVLALNLSEQNLNFAKKKKKKKKKKNKQTKGEVVDVFIVEDVSNVQREHTSRRRTGHENVNNEENKQINIMNIGSLNAFQNRIKTGNVKKNSWITTKEKYFEGYYYLISYL